MERHKKDFVLTFVNFLKRCKENVPIISNNGNINRAMKMKFLNYKYFPANNKKEIEGSHYLLLNQKEMLRSLNICC